MQSQMKQSELIQYTVYPQSFLKLKASYKLRAWPTQSLYNRFCSSTLLSYQTLSTKDNTDLECTSKLQAFKKASSLMGLGIQAQHSYRHSYSYCTYTIYMSPHHDLANFLILPNDSFFDRPFQAFYMPDGLSMFCEAMVPPVLCTPTVGRTTLRQTTIRRTTHSRTT